jgi:shikimate kinase
MNMMGPWACRREGARPCPFQYSVDVPRPDLILIGLRGSGKSVVGRATGARLGRLFIDLDDLTPALMGYSSVAAAWTAAGEPAFRLAEISALRQVMLDEPSSGRVIALGGGTPTAPGATTILNESRRSGSATIMYLRAAAQTLRSRLEGSDNRDRPPLTTASDPLNEIEQVLLQRDPLYLTLADTVINTDGLTLDQVIDAVVAKE